ncbi:MAG: hypothetical protein HHAS10_06010 [Candidatus Altimarinota bacterium]
MPENKRYLLFFLLVVPGLFAELLSGNTPIMKFANPVDFFFLVLAYGVPIILIWEFKIRYKISSLGVYFLGIAYGIFNEGLIAKTLLATSPVPFGGFQTLSNFFGINWSWLIMILPWHAFFSVLFPIILAEYFFAKNGDISLVSRKWFAIGVLNTFVFMPMLALSWQGSISLILYICFFGGIFLLLGFSRFSFLQKKFILSTSTGMKWGIFLIAIYLFQFIAVGKIHIAFYIFLSIIGISFFLKKLLFLSIFERARFALGAYISFGGFALLVSLFSGRIDMIFSYTFLVGMLYYSLRKHARGS